MKTKDTQVQAQRLARRNTLIQFVFEELRKDKSRSFFSIYDFLGSILGLGENQIRKIILGPKVESSLSGDDLLLFSVILQRILEKRIKIESKEL